MSQSLEFGISHVEHLGFYLLPVATCAEVVQIRT